MTDEKLREIKRHFWPNAPDYKPEEEKDQKCMIKNNNNSFIASFFGKIFHGCWHRYKEWSQPFRGRRSVSYQEKECRKCGRVTRRTVSMDSSTRDRKSGAKPKKPKKPPQVKQTPRPPTGGTGESS